MCARFLDVHMPDVLVGLLTIESGRGIQVVQRHEVHPVELELDDEDYDGEQEPRKHVRVRVKLALAHPFGYKVKFEWMQTKQHGE
jgi:hypothetical protein